MHTASLVRRDGLISALVTTSRARLQAQAWCCDLCWDEPISPSQRYRYTELSVSVTVTHWDFVWHLHISNPRGLCHLLRHRLPTSRQQFINQAPVVKYFLIGQLCLDAHLPIRCQHIGNLCTQCSSYKPEGIHECSTFNFIFIDNYFNGVFKSMS